MSYSCSLVSPICGTVLGFSFRFKPRDSLLPIIPPIPNQVLLGGHTFLLSPLLNTQRGHWGSSPHLSSLFIVFVFEKTFKQCLFHHPLGELVLQKHSGICTPLLEPSTVPIHSRHLLLNASQSVPENLHLYQVLESREPLGVTVFFLLSVAVPSLKV